MPRIAVCFFGITRSLTHTFPSIKKNILDACESCGDTRIYSHFFNQTTLTAPRSKEFGVLDTSEHRLIPSDWLQLEEPDSQFLQKRCDEFGAFGDAFSDNFRTMRNLVHQLHSLEQVSLAALSWPPDISVFVRPDLKYLDSFLDALRCAITGTDDAIWLPNWQHWNGGFNDRFAICRGLRASRAFGLRGRLAIDFCKQTGKPLDPEKLVRFAVEHYEIPPNFIRLRAVRVRLGGVEHRESFLDYRLHNIWQKLAYGGYK